MAAKRASRQASAADDDKNIHMTDKRFMELINAERELAPAREQLECMRLKEAEKAQRIEELDARMDKCLAEVDYWSARTSAAENLLNLQFNGGPVKSIGRFND